MALAATEKKSYVLYDVSAEPAAMEPTCGDLFDHIDDLLDFPCKDDLLLEVAAPPSSSGVLAGAPLLLPLPDDTFLCQPPPPPVAAASTASSAPASTAAYPAAGQLGPVPCDDLDMAQLEWLSKFFDDTADPSLLGLPSSNISATALKTSAIVKEQEPVLFRTTSPVSVLEHNGFNSGNGSGSNSFSSHSSSSSSSSSTSFFRSGGERPTPEPSLVIPARARSKRPRPAAFSARAHIAVPVLPPSSYCLPPAAPVATSCSDPESIDESSPPPSPVKKKKAKKAFLVGGEEPEVRRCMHCRIEKTPQWRAGPMGPKTLCNACGVRYKSGRLFPEYRPAASPTFVPSLHSNSHKKVVEMRLKAVTIPSIRAGGDLGVYIRRKN